MPAQASPDKLCAYLADHGLERAKHRVAVTASDQLTRLRQPG
jgi:hypothetical protein